MMFLTLKNGFIVSLHYPHTIPTLSERYSNAIGMEFQDSGFKVELHSSSSSPRQSSCEHGSALGSSSAQGSSERKALLNELCRLRRHWPEAPILGESELDTSSSHAPVRVSAAMNALRRAMSDLP